MTTDFDKQREALERVCGQVADSMRATGIAADEAIANAIHAAKCYPSADDIVRALAAAKKKPEAHQ